MSVKTDFLVIGSGIAGLRAALELADKGKDVALVTKGKMEESNTYYAQGGIAAVDPLRVEQGNDNYESHTKDTHTAGDGLCNDAVVKKFTQNAYTDVIDFLIAQGVKFTEAKDGYKFELHQEGGHAHERIYCVGDYTGRAIEQTLADAVRNNPHIKVYENNNAVNLITHNNTFKVQLPDDRCLGAYVLDRETGEVRLFQAQKVFLATGGAGRVFQYTSNPEIATGDGVAMAYRAGARVANMEFFQFHPTVLYEPNPVNPAEKRFLITEALRGEKAGGILTLEKNSLDDFVTKYDTRGSHATRDIVARAIDTEMKMRGLKHVWLNLSRQATGKDADYLRGSFPQVYDGCMQRGIDITTDPIPVVPAAHYMCGGVLVDEFGQTDINGLYAIGEVACTGLMGANRLASNSLPEAALYGKLAVAHALTDYRDGADAFPELPEWDKGMARKDVDVATVNQFWDTTRITMTNLCGIDRNAQRLQLAVKTLTALEDAAQEIYWDFYPQHEIIHLRNLTLVARLIAESALGREESRGCHYRADYPSKDKIAMPTVLRIGGENYGAKYERK